MCFRKQHTRIDEKQGIRNSICLIFAVGENLSLRGYTCIVARGEDTFMRPEGLEYLKKWNVPENMECKCFVLLGYVDGEYPGIKERRVGRVMVVTE